MARKRRKTLAYEDDDVVTPVRGRERISIQGVRSEARGVVRRIEVRQGHNLGGRSKFNRGVSRTQPRTNQRETRERERQAGGGQANGVVSSKEVCQGHNLEQTDGVAGRRHSLSSQLSSMQSDQPTFKEAELHHLSRNPAGHRPAKPAGYGKDDQVDS
jgi:hypothetical protein